MKTLQNKVDLLKRILRRQNAAIKLYEGTLIQNSHQIAKLQDMVELLTWANKAMKKRLR